MSNINIVKAELAAVTDKVGDVRALTDQGLGHLEDSLELYTTAVAGSETPQSEAAVAPLEYGLDRKSVIATALGSVVTAIETYESTL